MRTKICRLFSLFLAVIFLMSFMTNVISAAPTATDDQIVTPYWVNTTGINLTLGFSDDGYAQLSVTLSGLSNTTFHDITIGLTKIDSPGKGLIKEWDGLSSTGPVFRFSNTSTKVTDEGTYSLSVIFTATRNGTSELINDHMEREYPQ